MRERANLILVGFAREAVRSYPEVDDPRQAREVWLGVGSPYGVDIGHEHRAVELEQLVEGRHLHRAHTPKSGLIRPDAAKVGRVAKLRII